MEMVSNQIKNLVCLYWHDASALPLDFLGSRRRLKIPPSVNNSAAGAGLIRNSTQAKAKEERKLD